MWEMLRIVLFFRSVIMYFSVFSVRGFEKVCAEIFVKLFNLLMDYFLNILLWVFLDI